MIHALLPFVVAQANSSHTFIYRADRELRRVVVAGTFNGWNRDANPMQVGPDGRTWTGRLDLPYGKHQYKFVLDGETWVTDPAAKSEDDGGGNMNSILIILPPGYEQPAKVGDGRITTSALLHPEEVPYRNYDRGKLTLSLRARPDDFERVEVHFFGGERRLPLRMVEIGRDDLYANYRVELPWDRKRDLQYAFLLRDGSASQWVRGKGEGGSNFVLRAKGFQPFEVPAWVERTVFYQIFPDRFLNGDKTNDPKDVRPWDAKPEWFNRFGGDIAGVRSKVPYLADLGVRSVYFNPVFKAPSNHRYDAEDFRQIDPEFGTNAEFGTLTRELDARGIRTVMDFVFNHTATTFPPFLDVRQKGEASAYKDWYFIKSYPVRVEENPNYVAWFNYPSMPKLNLSNPAARRYMLGLTDFWQKQAKVSGLRLDVANEVEMGFWRDLRRTLKTRNKDTWIVGEVWGDGSPWLKGDQWDSVMNYQFRDACLRFFAQGNSKPTDFMNRLMRVHGSYVPQVSRNMMNLLSSHDTPRFLTLCNEDERLHKLAAAVQFTWVGAPSIYYGEELGMRGGPDPDNRRGMEWSRATPENAMLAFYKKLIRVRNASRALQSGDPSVLLADDAAGTVAYARTLDKEIALVALNRSSETRTVTLSLPSGFVVSRLKDAITGNEFSVSDRKVQIMLEPLSASVLLPASSSRSAARPARSALSSTYTTVRR